MGCNTKVSYISSLNSCNEERSHGNVKREKAKLQIKAIWFKFRRKYEIQYLGFSNPQ
jgi:hypothetical protein